VNSSGLQVCDLRIGRYRIDSGPVGGEFVVKRPSGFEIILGNAVAMRRN
jgi:hypothetical protein